MIVYFLLAGLLAFSEPHKAVEPRLPELKSVFPQGAEAGAKLRVEILGEYLDRTQAVVFLDSSIQGKVAESSYTRAVVDFSVNAGAPLGPHYFRVVTPRGASNVLLFRIGDQPHILEKEPNSTIEQAQEVKLPVTVNGRLDKDGDFDFYRFHAGKSENWIFDLRAARNGNGLDAALILLDGSGRKLYHSEDVFIWDPFIDYTFPETGDYYVVVQPTHRNNDPNFGYQLDIRTAPHLETIAPLSIRPGATIEATLFGAGLNGAGKLWFSSPGFSGEVLEMRGKTARVKIQCPANAPEGPTQVAVITSGGRSDPATLLVDATPAYSGGEVIHAPVSIDGIARYRQPERFAFDVKAGETLDFEVRAQRFGSPVDSLVRIVDTLGNQIAADDDYDFPGSHFSKDSFISHQFKDAGRYFVEIRNLWKTTGEDFPYQLLVYLPRPRFELEINTDNPYLYPGAPGVLIAKVIRHDGFEGPVRVEVKGLPAGITAEAAEAAAGKNEALIPLRAAPDAKPGVYGNFRVVAEGSADAAWRSVRISSGGGEGETFATVNQATVAVIEKPAFSLEAQVETVHLVRGGTIELPVTIQRADGFSEKVHFSFENLPSAITAEEKTASGESQSVKILLTARKDARPGRYTRIAILGRAESGQIEEAPQITLVLD
ncbi:MAG TPA: hypothetical protein VJN43_11460 [Bryobacteraceae bacterium]|nr:hypothetical protein [Bryobacteraceae bacterium]